MGPGPGRGSGPLLATNASSRRRPGSDSRWPSANGPTPAPALAGTTSAALLSPVAEPKPSPDAPPAAFSETGPRRELEGTAWRIVAGIALAFSAYQLVIAAFAPLSSLVTRSLHVGFLLLLALLTH